MTNEVDYVELGLGCADICRALDRGMNGKKLDDLTQSVCEAISQLTTCVKPMIHTIWVGLLTTSSIAAPWRRSKGRSSSRADETRSPDSSKQEMIRKQSLLGS